MEKKKVYPPALSNYSKEWNKTDFFKNQKQTKKSLCILLLAFFKMYEISYICGPQHGDQESNSWLQAA